MKDYDFAGWATRNDLVCTDGRTIKRDAFKHCHGKEVPIVWNHDHNNPDNVLGHGVLENRPEGVYVYGKFNNSARGLSAKEAVIHGDVTALSIFANKLKQNSNRDVLHGDIKEVSLVLAGANPGAYIEDVFAHGEDESDEAYIYANDFEPLEICHSDDSDDSNDSDDSDDGDETVLDVFNGMTEKQKAVCLALMEAAKGEHMNKNKDQIEHAETEETEKNEQTVQDVIESLNEDQYKTLSIMVALAAGEADEGSIDDETRAELKHTFDTFSDTQKDVAYFIIGKVAEDDENQNDKNIEGGNSNMKKNVFEAQHTEEMDDVMVLSHAEELEIISDMKKHGSLRESYLAHVDGAEAALPTYTMGDHTYNYGMANIGYLFPENKELNSGAPEFIKKPDAWVSAVMNGVHRSPFARVKTTFADVTMDEARALGYKVKGQYKHEEAFRLMKRTTDPTTIYKKQKLDRDDIVDITGFDVIAWIRGEMRMKLDEEIARAILIGDGRSTSSDDKIEETKVRPIWTDEDFFTIKEAVTVAADADEDAVARAFIRKAIKARKNYRGSGNCTLFTTEDMLTDMLLLEDLNGRIIYDSEAKLCSALRVKNIVTVPEMENKKRNVEGVDRPLMGIIVNMNDYNVGADKGGAVNMFDDFDIDYNQQKYLIETRISGALTKYHSAIVLEKVVAPAQA